LPWHREPARKHHEISSSVEASHKVSKNTKQLKCMALDCVTILLRTSPKYPKDHGGWLSMSAELMS